jgi:hypothetical protein
MMRVVCAGGTTALIHLPAKCRHFEITSSSAFVFSFGHPPSAADPAHEGWLGSTGATLRRMGERVGREGVGGYEMRI